MRAALERPLNAVERQRLARLEDVIERGRKAFIEVGQALLEVRDGRLYREGHDTFEAYCRERWEFGRSYAYELIDASRGALVVSGIPDIEPPSNAAQAAELVPLLPDENALVGAWRELAPSTASASPRDKSRTPSSMSASASTTCSPRSAQYVFDSNAAAKTRLRAGREVRTSGSVTSMTTSRRSTRGR
jgi:hypothetical protein